MNLFVCDNTPVLEALYDFNENMDRVINEAKVISALENYIDTFLLEDTSSKVKETKDKVVNFIKELLKRIRDWFKDIITKLKNFFNIRKSFLAKHSTEIKENTKKVKEELKEINKSSTQDKDTLKSKYELSEYIRYVPALVLQSCERITENIVTAGNELIRKVLLTDLSASDIKTHIYKKSFHNVDTSYMPKFNPNDHIESASDINQFIQAHKTIKSNYVLTDEDIDAITDIVNNSDDYISYIKNIENDYTKMINDSLHQVNSNPDHGFADVNRMILNATNTIMSAVSQYCINYLTTAYNYNFRLYSKLFINND